MEPHREHALIAVQAAHPDQSLAGIARGVLLLGAAAGALVAGQARTPLAHGDIDAVRTALAEPGSGIANVHLDAVEHRGADGNESLVFMHAVKDGPADRSFGLQVAALPPLAVPPGDVEGHPALYAPAGTIVSTTPAAS